MENNTNEQFNNTNQDTDRLSDNDLDAVNGGGIIEKAQDFVENTIDKAVDLYNDAKDSIDTIKKYR